MNLSFYKDLNESQKQYAQKIAAKAREMGVPPELAVAIAFKESGLNPKVQAGGAGEVGIMQIKPDTAKEVGFSVEDIRDPEKNIEAGLKYMKKSLDMSEGNPKLAAAGYNAGINHPFFTSKGTNLPDITVNYLKDLKGYGAFPATTAAPAAQGKPSDIEFEPPETLDSSEFQKQIEAVREKSARGRGQIIGGAAGTGLTAARIAKPVIGSAARFIGGAAEEGRQAAIQRAAPQPPVGGALAPQLASEATAANRILQGTTDVDTGTTGRARMSGFNIESAQQAARTKEAARQIGALQQAGVGTKTAQQLLAEAPGLTASASGVVYPRSAPPATPVAPRGGLDEVTRLFRQMIEPGSRTRALASTALRYGAPPLAGYQMGSELGSMAAESQKEKPDYEKMGLSGLSALGLGMSLFPTTAPVGIPLAITAPLLQYARENPAAGPLGQTGEITAP
jgi:hypothetical protein